MRISQLKVITLTVAIMVTVWIFLHERCLKYHHRENSFISCQKDTTGSAGNYKNGFTLMMNDNYQATMHERNDLSENPSMQSFVKEHSSTDIVIISSMGKKTSGFLTKISTKASLPKSRLFDTTLKNSDSAVGKAIIYRLNARSKPVLMNESKQRFNSVKKTEIGKKAPLAGKKNMIVSEATRNKIVEIEDGTILETTRIREAQSRVGCPTWKYEKQEWTIKYFGTAAEYNNKICAKPDLGQHIKRVSFNDGTFLNTGCNARTFACKEYPFYDFKNGMRINSPPCCRHHLLTMLEHVTKALQKQGVPHSLISGGVIGWVRDKKMIPYDRDLDVILNIDYWNTTEFWQMFENMERQFGYVVKPVESFKVKLCLSKKNENNVDIWAYFVEKGTMRIHYHGFSKQSISTMVPFKLVKFEWFDTYVPAKPIDYLDKQYGKEVWRPEKQCMVRNSEGDCW